VVRIGEGSFAPALASGADIVLADRFFAPMLENSSVPVVYLDADEESKTLQRAEQLIVACFDAGARRGTRLLAVGGGVVQDLATLVSSLYMRGLPWSYAPTTLMAMADSCVGGKSSINAGKAKNVVGNIYPPREVTIDPGFLSTLSDEELVAGLSEAVKICFCHGLGCFQQYLRHFESFSSDPAAAPLLLHHVLSAKKWFVEVDEFDTKERRLLNFGHTFAHALESATSFSVNHGVAVAVGMLCAVRLAAMDGQRGEASSRLAAHCRVLLARVPDLASRLADLDEAQFEQAFRADKKHAPGEFRLILPSAGGGVQEVPSDDGTGRMKAVLEALRRVVAEVGV